MIKQTNSIKTLCQYALVIVVLLQLLRLVFTIIFVSASLLYASVHFAPKLLFNALRFDLQVAAYALLLPTLLSLVSTIFTKQDKCKRIVQQIIRWYFVIIYLLIIVLGIVDLGFYANFNTHINITFFDFFQENPLSLLQAIWQEYHCMWYALVLIIVARILVWLTKNISKATTSLCGGKLLLAVCIYVVVLVVCLRGSVWMFPLQIEDTFVSDVKEINDIVPNAPYMLKKAYKEKLYAFHLKSTNELLKQYHFTSIQQALDIYTNGKVLLQKTDTLVALQKALFTNVSAANQYHKPNIVIIYSESWSNYLFRLHTMHSDMYMGLNKHFKEDLLFRNFQSVQNGTIASIENLTVGTPYPRFFASKYRLTALPTSIAIPFNKSGYTTAFISGMDMAWENSAEALTAQQYQEIKDKFSILRDNAKAQYNSIGVYDEYLFQYLLKQLVMPSNKPKMITVMTTTNHPPFEFPAHLQLAPLTNHWYANKCFAQTNQAVLKKYIDGFRYYNKALNTFLTLFKKSKAAHNTILIVTGDHNVRSILNYNVVNKRWKYSVPLYIYLPPYLQRPAYRKTTKRWGCHDDLIPTLAPFAFQHTQYFKLGNNLLDTTNTKIPYSSYNVEQILPNNKRAQRRIQARNLLRDIYFQHILR